MDKEIKLTAEQIEHLYVFTRRHFVDYYDLQTELVDHLANAIEQKWTEQPNVSFEQALQQEFKKFGIFGFTTLVEKRQVVLTKKYNRMLWGYFREFFKLPKIMLTIALTGLIYLLIQSSPIAFSMLFIILMLFGIIRLIQMNVKYRKKVKNTGKRWMLEEIIFRCGSFGIYLQIPIQLNRFLFEDSYPELGIWLLSGSLVVIALYQYVVLILIPSKAGEHIKETYPEYAMEIPK